jgi:cytochrome c oxidase subunit 2
VGSVAATTTQAINFVYLYIFGFSIFLLVGITVTMIVFVLKYNVKRHPVPEPSPDSVAWLEATWIAVPVLISLSMFYFGWKGFTALSQVPPGAMVVQVIGQQWVWSFQYPNGKTSDKLYVPVNRPIKLELTSRDVIHSFFVPAFRIKKDAVPGMTTYEWFEAKKEGSYDAFCAQYCGLGHSRMTTKVVVMPEDKFQEWYQAKPAQTPAARGKALLDKFGCTGCHSLDGSRKVGPTLKGVYGRRVTVLTRGKERTLTAGAAYIKRSILDPHADIVKGFQPVMPSFKGKISERQIEEIIEFLEEESGKKQKPSEEAGRVAEGKRLAAQEGCHACHSTDGSKGIGPTWKGLYGSEVTVTTGGKERTIKADTAYISRSIEHPEADIVKGFQPVMPKFPNLTEKQVRDLVAYIESIK